MSNLFQKKEVHLFYNLGTDKRPEKFRPFVIQRAAIAISVLAGEVGSWILYFLGMYGGNAFLKIYLKRFPKHKPAFERTFDLIRRKGFYGIFISKLIPMVRTLISIPAGVLKMEFIKYSIASFLGVTLWNTLFVGAGYIIGEPILKIVTRG